MSAAKPCQTELTEAFICTQVLGPSECDCFDATTFITLFEQQTREAYLSTQAFASPTDVNFCDWANDRVCGFYKQNQSCCCQAETENYRKCLVEKTFPQELPTPIAYETASCQNSCTKNLGGSEVSGSDGDSTLLVAAAVTVVISILVAVAVFFHCHRRRRLSAASSDIPNSVYVEKATAKESFRWGAKRSGAEQQLRDQTTDEVSEESPQHDLESGLKEDEDKMLERSRSSPKKNPLKEKCKTLAHPPEDCGGDDDESLVLTSAAEYEEQLKGLSKAEKLKKKSHAIESWNEERKEGSNRSLQSYLSDNDISKEDKTSREKKRAKRRSKRREEDINNEENEE
jgi:hypothetical protein